MDVVRHLTLLTLRYNFYLKVQLIEGKRNDIADLLSRFQMERFRMLAPHADPAPCQVPQALWEIYKQISAITFNCPLQPQLNKLTPLLKNGSWISAPSIAHSLEIAFQRKKDTLTQYVAYLAKSIDSSINGCLAAVCHFHIFHGFAVDLNTFLRLKRVCRDIK